MKEVFIGFLIVNLLLCVTVCIQETKVELLTYSVFSPLSL